MNDLERINLFAEVAECLGNYDEETEDKVSVLLELACQYSAQQDVPEKLTLEEFLLSAQHAYEAYFRD